MSGGFICPVCHQPLHVTDTGCACENRHSFDRAKQGYVNLLLSNQMHAKLPGDNKQMVQARRSFLDCGYYACLMQAVCAAVVRLVSDGQTILDIGCGEGYYTASIQTALQHAEKSVQLLGIDISKHALAIAARRAPDVKFAVASAFHLPVQSNGADLLLNLFAPFCLPECQRVLPSGGKLLLVIPAERHLWQLKCAIYDAPYLNQVKEDTLDGFTLLQRSSVRDTITVGSQTELQQLFSMTPYLYNTSHVGLTRLAALETLTTELAFELLEYERK